MLSEAENVVNCVQFGYLFALVPLLLVVSVPGTVATSGVSNQYLVYRVHQIDLPHGSFGSRNSVFNLEAVTPTQLSNSFIRKCALFKLSDLVRNSYDIFLDQVLSQSLVSAVLIIYKDLQSGFSEAEIASLQTIERKLLTNETSLPIYLVEDNEEINSLYEEYRQTKETVNPSFYDFIVKNIFFDSHQFVITGPQTTMINNAVVSSLQAKLIGAGPEDQLPTYAIVAHYDSYSAVPGLAYGADSNASGLVLLLELMRIFSKLYANNKTRPKANLFFFVSGGGKINYFGTKKWLEENLDSTHTATSTLFENMQFALCLDSLADSVESNGLFMYVSKPPKAGTSTATFWENLKNIANRNYPSINSSMIHKKINLADDFLSWEHERFSMRRISAFTLSSIATPKSMKRQTVMDVYHESYINTLEMHANIIGEVFVRLLYGSIEENLLKLEFSVSRPFIKSLFEHATNIPRTQQMLLSTSKGSSYQLPPFLKTVQTIMRKYSNNHIRILHSKLDSRNPEFVFYDPIITKMNIYNMKPAAFDFIITILIASYLAIFYLAVKNFHYFSLSKSTVYDSSAAKIKVK